MNLRTDGIWTRCFLTAACMMMLVCVSFNAAPVIAQARSATTQSQSPSITELLKALKSNEFEQRQSATQAILDLGPTVLPQLKSVEPSSSLEVNRRIETLIAVLEAIDAGEESKAAQEAWLQFRDAEFETRDLILEKLLALKLYRTHFALLSQLDDSQIRAVFEDNGNYFSVIARLCRAGRWTEIETILSSPLFWKHQPKVCGRYHLLMGTLDQQIQLMRQRIDRASTTRNAAGDGENPATRGNNTGRTLDGDDVTLNTLIGLLMYQRQYKTAEGYIDRIAQNEVRRDKMNRLLFNQGDWKKLADRAVLTDSEFDRTKPFFECGPRRYMLLKQYGDGPQAGAVAVQKIRDLETAAGTLDEGLITMLHLLNLNWEAAKPGLGLEQDETSLRILNLVSWPIEMLELSGAGTTFATRQQWAGKQREKMQVQIDRLKRLQKKPSSNNQQAIIGKIVETLDYYVVVCEHMLELGLEEEAILYLRQAYVQIHDIDDLSDSADKIVASICEPRRPDFTLPFLQEAGLSDRKLNGMIGSSSVFGNEPRSQDYSRVGQAKFLNFALLDKVSDPWERLQRIAFLLNSALKPTDPKIVNRLYPNGFDLDAELAMVDHPSNRNSCWQISLIYQFHQREEEARQWKKMAAMRGNATALFQIAEETFKEADYLTAAKLFDAHFRESSDFYALGLASRAYELAGQSQIARRRMFYASVIPDYYDSSMSAFYRKFTGDERGEWVCELTRLEICLEDYPRQSQFRDAMLAYKSTDSVESANFGRRGILELDTVYTPYAFLLVSSFNVESRTQDLMAAIEQGDFELAQAIFDQVETFSPGSPSLVEKAVPRLDQLGQTKLADEFTYRASAFFTETLKQFPNSANHRNNYAWVLACAGRRLDSLLRHAETAVALRPDQATYIDTLAEGHYARGEYEQAIGWIKKAISLDPPRVYYRNQLRKFQMALNAAADQ